MSMKQKKYFMISALLILTILLTGCEQQKEKYITQTDDTTTISFSWWGNDERHLYTLEAMDVFESKNPELNVRTYYSVWNGYEKRIRAYMESHTEADIMQINYAWLDLFSPEGDGFYDLYTLADIIHLETYDKEELSYGEINGKLNAVPVSFNSYMVYHNRDLYQKYGLEVPKTWDDYFLAAEKMRGDGIYPMGAVKKQIFFLLISYFEQTKGKLVFEDNGQFLLSEEDMKYILEFSKRLLDEKVIMPTEEFERTLFIEQKTAATIAWVTDASGYCQELLDNGVEAVIGDYPMVQSPKLNGRYIKPSCMYAMSKNTENPKEAARLLRFLVNGVEMLELQKLEKGVPAGETAMSILNRGKMLQGILYEAHQKMQQDRSLMRLIVPVMELEDVINAFKQNADEYLFGKMDIEMCAKQICQDINAIVEDM